ncbi:MAG: ATP/GTP-binding protein [Thermoplasmata archaeon]|nr:ATP/GTP-binding protein [Candidatus Thermoplasmatota archaeon]MCK4948928.1 ATP/GTP-binding protein [Thermoplasmata archaeon]
MSKYLFLVGTAGCGKTTMTYAFRTWMSAQGFDSITVNLDPGVEDLQYEPEVDVRDWVTLEAVMQEYQLGPNGAQIACADLIALQIREIVQTLEGFDTDYVFIDTPGQMELFAFRESSREVVHVFGAENTAIIFLLDPQLAKRPSGLVSLLMLSVTTGFRFSVPLINVLSKSDFLSDEEVAQVLGWGSSSDRLYDALVEEMGDPAGIPSIGFLHALDDVGAYRELIPISSEALLGFEDLYSLIQLCFEGGEDLYKD